MFITSSSRSIAHGDARALTAGTGTLNPECLACLVSPLSESTACKFRKMRIDTSCFITCIIMNNGHIITIVYSDRASVALVTRHLTSHSHLIPQASRVIGAITSRAL